MGDTLHKMQVIIEATTEPLKKGMENSRREVKKSVEEIQKETEKVKNPFKGMESKALQPVRNTLNKIREKQGFQNLAQYSGETNRSLSLLMSSLTQLKNSLATAFAPILNVVAPILNSFIQTVINVVNSIGQLMGALTGKTTMVTAKKVNQDYAASLNSTSNSHCSVAVISLASEEIRNKQLAGEIQQPYQKIVTYETEKFSDLSIKEAYEYLKTLLEFEGAEDVFEDKDNSV